MRRAFLRGLVCVALLALNGCGEEPPPEGFEIQLRFVSLDPVVLDNVRVQFIPEDTQRFMFVEPMSFEDGRVGLEVAADGVVILTLNGQLVAERSVPQGDGSSIYTLEVWTTDTRVRDPAPSVRVTANRDLEVIGEGFLYLPSWPVELGENVLLPVSCTASAVTRGVCRP